MGETIAVSIQLSAIRRSFQLLACCTLPLPAGILARKVSPSHRGWPATPLSLWERDSFKAFGFEAG
jgi:hypothetical protein